MQDAIGNKLEKGQRVQLETGSPRVMGIITSVSPGGLVSGPGGREVPSKVTVTCAFELLADGVKPVFGSLLRLHDPSEDGADTSKLRLI